MDVRCSLVSMAGSTLGEMRSSQTWRSTAELLWQADQVLPEMSQVLAGVISDPNLQRTCRGLLCDYLCHLILCATSQGAEASMWEVKERCP